MNFNKHYDFEGQHAFLSPSKYHWLDYDEEKLADTYLKMTAVEKGIRLHDLAMRCIQLGVKLPKTRSTLSMYVNDGIGYRMTTEQLLFYSPNAFGTADTICFRDKFLRIHDLKTGFSSASMRQLQIYTALFCLEYDIKPQDIKIELRKYQQDDILIENPVVENILFIMNKIVVFDKRIELLKLEG